jgi:DNA-binding NarL/FixJ family response regulator
MDDMDGKRALIWAFGEETGTALYGAAVRLSNRYGVALGDVIGDMSIAALEIEADYGFCHVNTVVNRTKSALYDTYRYGINRYYAEQGVAVDSMEALVNEDDDRAPEEVLEIEALAFATVEDAEIALDIAATLDTLTDRDREIASGLLAGLSGAEIGRRLDIDPSYVSRRKQALREAFAWATA